MNKLIALLIITSIIISCGQQSNKTTQQDQSKETQTIAPANLETIEIAVYGMTCGGCERTVQTAVGKLQGVQSVVASHLDSTAIVTFDKTKATFGEMKTAIADKGYKAGDFRVIEQKLQ